MKNSEIGKLSNKRRPQILSNLEKMESFKDSIQIFNDWNKLTDSERDEINPTEKVGIYCIVFSLLEDRLETFWWNCSYVHGWKTINEFDEDRQEMTSRGEKGRPPNEFEFKSRKIPIEIRTTGRFRKDLFVNSKLDQKLYDRIMKSEWDRRELIHRNMYFQKDLMDKHITEVMELFREVDRLLQKHKRSHKDKIS